MMKKSIFDLQKLVLTILFLLISTFSFGGIGISDWSCETPGGNEINNFIDRTLYLQNGTQVENLHNWYFYKGFIIGQIRGENSEISSYFAVDESSYKINIFNKKSEWLSFLKQEKLNPIIWTRWYEYAWKSNSADFILLLILVPYIVIPLIAFYFFIMFKATRKEGLNIKKPYTIIFLLITIFIFINLLLEIFPQSI